MPGAALPLPLPLPLPRVHSPPQAARRIRPLPNWPSTVRSPNSTTRMKGMHCRAAKRTESGHGQSPQPALAAREEALQPRCPPAQHGLRGEGKDPFLSQLSQPGPKREGREGRREGGRMAVLDRTVGAEEFAHSDEHELLGDLPWGIQLGQELG